MVPTDVFITSCATLPQSSMPGRPISTLLLLSFRTHYSHLCIQQRAVYLSSALWHGAACVCKCVCVYRAGLYLRSLHCDRDHKYGSRVMSSSTCLKRLYLFLSLFSPHFHLSHMIYRDGCKSYLNYIFHFPYFHLIKLQLGEQQGQTCMYMLVKDRAAPQASVIRIININKKWCCVEPTVFITRTILPLARWFWKIQFDATLCFSD